MNKELRNLLKTINNKKAEAKKLVQDSKYDEAKVLTDEIENLQTEFEVKSAIFEEEKGSIDIPEPSNKNEKADAVKAFYKVLQGKSLTEAENALLTGGDKEANSENYLVPQDIHTEIKELRREYKSARPLIGYYNTSTLTGSFVFENSDSITELTNFTDGDDISESDKPKFKNVPYNVMDYGALLPISRKLLKNETGGLLSYLGKWFNRKAVRTENKKIFAELKNGKKVKTLKGYKDLKSSINKDLDPALLIGMKIITNQDGFDYLDSEVDGIGRPILQPNPSNPTQKLFIGFPVEVFSNAELPTASGKAPIIYGSTVDGATFIDRDQLQLDMSEHALFKKNQVAARLIESFDVIGADKDAYIYGQIDLTAATTPEPTTTA
ncbi:phage major capsid protein [Bacillus subtilis]|uniref:Phage major capsid protein n=1 Tax=Bacillus subtilis TaxID=1423 RepID=A0A8I1WJB5_BACIU|nr:phage major capsid protein [Bacillus subtilis]MBO3796833.1 phage major capsid protein [Bacillus subtilis]